MNWINIMKWTVKEISVAEPEMNIHILLHDKPEW